MIGARAIVCLFASSLIISGCEQSPERQSTQRARATFAKFARAFESKTDEWGDKPNGRRTEYSVKATDGKGTGARSYWMRVQSIASGQIAGVVTAVENGENSSATGKQPAVYVSESRTVPSHSIDDWSIDDGLKAEGGYSYYELDPQLIKAQNKLGLPRGEESLDKRWTGFVKQARAHESVTMVDADIFTLGEIERLKRLVAGNEGMPATSAKLSALSGLKVSTVEKIEEFWRLKSANAGPVK